MAEVRISRISLTVEQDAIIDKEKQLTLKPLESKEVMLDLIPKQTGDLVISGIEWEIFEVVQCNFNFK